MAITYLGSLSIGACIPMPTLAINAAFTDLSARIDALLNFNPQPISFALQLDLLDKMRIGIQSMITLGIPAPPINAQIAIVLALVEALRLQLNLINTIQSNLGALGVYAYAYEGRADAFGGALAGELSAGFPDGSPADHTNALVLATTTPACWTAMQALFRTTP